ncbi:hypothetical protein K440DRAFT_646195 [Wilcoxina mikolae CBS 423.85]|nr:hypothetical protein K440DRAFT_646195 [Wilcoxina mikolae CBS 423.85]
MPPESQSSADGKIISILIALSFGLFAMGKEALATTVVEKMRYVGMTAVAGQGSQMVDFLLGPEAQNNYNQETIKITEMQMQGGLRSENKNPVDMAISTGKILCDSLDNWSSCNQWWYDADTDTTYTLENTETNLTFDGMPKPSDTPEFTNCANSKNWMRIGCPKGACICAPCSYMGPELALLEMVKPACDAAKNKCL